MPGEQTTCELCGGSYNAGTDLSRFGCPCMKAKIAAAKASKQALGNERPTAPPANSNLGSPVQCEDCWQFYSKGVNMREFGCPCAKAQHEAVAAARAAGK